MKNTVFTLASVMVLSCQSLAGNCNSNNLVGEWTRQTELGAVPDAKCGEAMEIEKTVYAFVYKNGKVLGSGSRATAKTFKKNSPCAPKTKMFRFPYVELLTNGSLSIMSENGAQAISDCNVSSDRSKVKIGINQYVRTK